MVDVLKVSSIPETIVLLLLIAAILVGGMKRIAVFSEKVVPIMVGAMF